MLSAVDSDDGGRPNSLSPAIVVYGSCLKVVLDANYDDGTIVDWSCRTKINTEPNALKLTTGAYSVAVSFVHFCLEALFLVDLRRHDR